MNIYKRTNCGDINQPNQKLLSVIIPTYNMQDYLPRCIQSIVSVVNKDRLEIIVVNDGSKDDSLAIAKKYADEYPGTGDCCCGGSAGHSMYPE